MSKTASISWSDVTVFAAVLALIGTLGTMSFNVFIHIRGPQVTAFDTEQVRLFGYLRDNEPADLAAVLALDFMNSSPARSDLITQQSIHITDDNGQIACLSSRAHVSLHETDDIAERAPVGAQNLLLRSASHKTTIPPGSFVTTRLVYDQRATSSDLDPCYTPIREEPVKLGEFIQRGQNNDIDLKIRIDFLHSTSKTLRCRVTLTPAAISSLTERHTTTLPCFTGESRSP